MDKAQIETLKAAVDAGLMTQEAAQKIISDALGIKTTGKSAGGRTPRVNGSAPLANVVVKPVELGGEEWLKFEQKGCRTATFRKTELSAALDKFERKEFHVNPNGKVAEGFVSGVRASNPEKVVRKELVELAKERGFI